MYLDVWLEFGADAAAKLALSGMEELYGIPMETLRLK